MKRCSPWQVPRNQHRCCSPRVRCTPRGPDTVPCSSNPFLILLLRFLRPPVNPNFSKIKKKKRAIKLTIWTVDNLTKSSHHHCKWVWWKTHWEMISGTHNKWSTFYYTSGEIYNKLHENGSSGRKNKGKMFPIFGCMSSSAYRLVVLQVRRAQDLNLIVQEPDISHRFMQHWCCICLHMIIFISIPHNQLTPLKFYQ